MSWADPSQRPRWHQPALERRIVVAYGYGEAVPIFIGRGAPLYTGGRYDSRYGVVGTPEDLATSTRITLFGESVAA
jgi:hypothetical protein